MSASAMPDESMGGRDADPIRMSVINAVIEILEYRVTYPGSSLVEAERVLARGLAASTGHAYSEAVELLSRMPEFRVPEGRDRRATLRRLLHELTLARRPSWARLIPKGRGFVAAYIPRNAYQCLESAGLYASVPDADALDWWDAIASHFRSDNDLGNTRIGREGERLTLAYEEERLARAGRPDLKPTWVSLDDNSLGYDVLSHKLDAEGRASPLHIEVKSSSVGAQQVFVTRNEWKFAATMKDSFLLYLWDLRSATLTKLTHEDLQAHIPIDQGVGKWQNVRLTRALSTSLLGE